MRLSAAGLGWSAMLAAIAAVVVAAVGAKTNGETVILLGVVLAVFALGTGGIGLRTAVRSDAGIAHSLFGLGFAFVALFVALFLLGVQRGGRYSGAPAGAVVTVVPGVVVSRIG